MSQYAFSQSPHSISALVNQPHLIDLRRITASTAKNLNAVHLHHDLAEICFIETGSTRCIVEKHPYNIERGDILFLNANTLHNLFDECSEDFSASLIRIAGLQLKSLGRGQIINKNFRPIIQSQSYEPIIRQHFSLLHALAPKSKDKDIAAAANHIIESLIIISTKLIMSRKSLFDGQEYNLGLRIKKYIDEHYLENLHLTTIADALHMNTYYLSHIFKQIIGYSPIQYMIHRRIGEAQKLLINTNLTVTDIALYCGYNNSNYFQIVFNNIVGMPPGKYRKAQ